jgi:sec-independent protein translocase protein TatC
MKRKHAQTTQLTADRKTQTPSELPTFLDHVYELRKRLFWVVAVIAVAASITYPFLDTIIGVLRAPLGSQQLYYLTPVGGLSFSIKICIYMGIMMAVPFIMYHLYRYLEPLMSSAWRKSALFYVGLSSFLAVIGVLFAYFVSLPGALQFLTGLNLSHIQAMLTVDSYLSFVMTYLLGAAILFQIPLLLLIINTMTPFKPGGLGKSQRFVIVAAFIIAAVISPTPDLMNQIIFALPIIIMYEVGVVLVWFQNRNHARRTRKEQLLAVKPRIEEAMPQYTPRPQPQSVATPAKAAMPQPAQSTIKPKLAPAPRYVDIMTTPRRQTPLRLQPAQPRLMVTRPRTIRVPTRSIDGFMPYRPHPTNAS